MPSILLVLCDQIFAVSPPPPLAPLSNEIISVIGRRLRCRQRSGNNRWSSAEDGLWSPEAGRRFVRGLQPREDCRPTLIRCGQSEVWPLLGRWLSEKEDRVHQTESFSDVSDETPASPAPVSQPSALPKSLCLCLLAATRCIYIYILLLPSTLSLAGALWTAG